MMFSSLLDLVWQVVINKNIYKGQFYYIGTLNEEQIQNWLNRNGYTLEIKDNKYYSYEISGADIYEKKC